MRTIQVYRTNKSKHSSSLLLTTHFHIQLFMYTKLMDLLFLFFGIFTLGFIGGAIPGPILTSAFTETIREGFIKSLRVVFFAAISEIIVATFIMFLLLSFHIPQSVFYAISIIGAAVLIWMALQIWSIKKLHSGGKIFDFKKIFLLTVFNGPLWIFWSTICVPQAYTLSQKIPLGQVVFLVLFELGWGSSTVLLTFLFSRFRPLLTKEGVISYVFKLFASILILFAIRLFATGILYFVK